MGKSTYLSIVDLEKAIDKVNGKLIFTSLQEVGIDWKTSLYL